MALSDVGKLALQREHTDLAALVAAAVERQRAAFLRKSIGLDLVPSAAPDAAWSAWVDPARLHQVLANVLDNAAKYVPSGGRVDVQLTREGNQHVGITIDDNGPGVAEADLPRLFDRFYRAGHRDARGSGLGLALCQRIVELHGGTIAASRSALGGLRIQILVPTQEGDA